MRSRFTYFIIFLCLIFWPVNLFLSNTFPNFISYSIPTVFLLISYFLYRKYPKYYLLPILLIPFFEKKLLFLPVIFCLLDYLLKPNKRVFTFFLISTAIFGIFFQSFKGQTVFNKDYEAEQLVLRNTQLYPNILSARFFQNKPRIYINKLNSNFFSLTDPNNYFFAFHPRPIEIVNQNLHKFPFFAIPFFLAGIFYIYRHPYAKFILISSIGCLISLTILNNFDRNDFVMWVPMGILMIYGIEQLNKKHPNIFYVISILLIIFSVPELIRDYIEAYLL